MEIITLTRENISHNNKYKWAKILNEKQNLSSWFRKKNKPLIKYISEQKVRAGLGKSTSRKHRQRLTQTKS